MRLRHPAPFADRWRGRWIWFTPPAISIETATRPVLADPTDTVGLFRRTIELEVPPDSAPCRIWADGRYVLSVNGNEVARGPVRSDPRRARYDVVDLAEHLRAGANVVALLARHFGRATSWWTPVPPSYSLGGGSVVFEALVGHEWITSDRSWRVSPGRGWTPVPLPGDVACLPLEWFDARAHDHGWLLPGFDDTGWAPATEIVPIHTGGHADPHPPSEPFGVLLPPVRSSFPSGATHRAEPGVQRNVADAPVPSDGPILADPVRQVLEDEGRLRGVDGSRTGATVGAGAAAPGTVVLQPFDLGHIAAGTVELEVRDAPAGTVVDLAAAEHLDDGGLLAPLGQHAGLRYVCGGGPVERFESLDVVGTRHLHASVRLPHATPAEAPELRIAVHDRHRPRPPGASFDCSDPELARIHQIGLRTVDLCALDAYVDCPTREQRAWTGDSVVHQMVDLVTNPDWSMAIWHPQLAAAPRSDGMLAMAPASDFAADDRTMVPDWSLHWIRSVHNLYRYVGDRELVAELLPVAERALRWFESYLGDDGLLHDVSGWVLLDWSSVYSTGCSSTLNALWARALEDVSAMASWLGNDGTAAWAQRRRDGARDAFEVFWDDRRGVYVDHLVDGTPGAQRPSTVVRRHSQPASSRQSVSSVSLPASPIGPAWCATRSSWTRSPSPAARPDTSTSSWATPSPSGTSRRRWSRPSRSSATSSMTASPGPAEPISSPRCAGTGTSSSKPARPRGPSAGPAAPAATAGPPRPPATSSCTRSASPRPSRATRP